LTLICEPFPQVGGALPPVCRFVTIIDDTLGQC
jgi:hypothetical protein